MRGTLLIAMASALLACGVSDDTGRDAAELTERDGSGTDVAAVPTSSSGPTDRGSKTAIDGTWRLAKINDTPIPPLAARLEYVFRSGRGTFSKNGVQTGDGFAYQVQGDQLFLTGAKEEALIDTGENLHHYTVAISGGTMTWSMASPLSSTGQQTMYVFQSR